MRNPLNRAVSMLGLMMIGAIAFQVTIGSLGLEDAAIRAAVTFGAVILLRRIGRFGVTMLAQSIERDGIRAGSATE